MRAVWMTAFGGPEVLVVKETPAPVPGAGQVVVDVAFANITFVETQFRSGLPGPFKGQPPLVPGNGVGGVVSAVGEGVDPGLVGQRVVTSLKGSGGYAEQAVADAGALFVVPEGLELDVAVALLADGRTATMLFDVTAPKAGERVLIEAAAGGVGSLLVQLAKNAGAVVVAAVGGERKGEVARELGADEVVDYREAGWTEGVAGVDVVFDGVGGSVGRDAFGLVKAGGRMVSYGLASGEWAGISEEQAAERGVRLVGLAPTPAIMRDATERVLADAAQGRVRALIGQRFPLERAADAHAAIQGRATVGKTLLEI